MNVTVKQCEPTCIEMIYLTRKVEFSAAHTLYNPALSPEENQHLFGKCGNPKGHGHNYVLEVTVRGEIDEKTGFFMNLETLKQILQEEIIEHLDHKNINLEVDFFKEHVATCENMARWIWDRLDVRIEGCELYRVRLYETRNNFVEYFGDDR
jgi:6-pyruvoyltetrahydropterin/6-carboxytetrahydropterin synthase